MDPLLRVGLELPPLPSPAVRSCRPGAGQAASTRWRAVASAAADSPSFGAVWAVGGPASTDEAGSTGEAGSTDESGSTCDACTLAGGLVETVPDRLVGVVATLQGGRHPAVLARDVTALDVVSGGRAALLLTIGDGGGGPGEDWQLAEAAAVCHALFTEAHPIFEGRHFHVAGAVNRPGPVRPGGPPVLVELAGPAGPGAADHDAVALVARVADAVVVTGGPEEVAAWTAVFEGRLPVLWRGVLGAPEAAAARPTAETAETAEAAEAAGLVRAGAQGFLVRLGRPELETADQDTATLAVTVRRLGEVLAAALAAGTP